MRVPEPYPLANATSTKITVRQNADTAIANTLGISKDSVMRSKRRLKNRLNLPDQTTVEEYLFNVLV